MEEQSVVLRRVLDQPLHVFDDIGLGRFEGRVGCIVGKEDDVGVIVAKAVCY